MPTTYGVTDEGFVPKTQAIIIQELGDDQRATISPDWDVSAESVMGQVNASHARQTALLWEVGETCYNATDRGKAEAALLDAVGRLTGSERDPADYSRVLMNFTLTAGTTLESGVHFVEHQDDPTSRWTPELDYTPTVSGAQTGVVFRSENKGPITAAAGKLTVISTPVTGWGGPTNPADAIPGREVADDVEYRLDQEAQIANAAGATVAGIAAAVSKLVSKFVGSSVIWFENPTPNYDPVTGLPRNSFEIVVWDGSTSGTNVTNNEIAETIWKKKGSGATPVGAITGTATDANGDAQSVAFSRATAVPIFTKFTLKVTAGFDAAAFKLAVTTALNSIHTSGKDVAQSRLVAVAWQQPNIDNVDSDGVQLGRLIAGATDDVGIGNREIGRFDTADVTLVLL